MHRRWAALLLVAPLAVTAGACGTHDRESGEGRSVAELGSDAASCTSTTTGTPPAVPDAIAAPLRPAAGETVTEAGSGTFVVTTSASVDDVFRRYQKAVVTAGFTVSKTDNEGREAEVYFKGSGSSEGSVLIARTNCPPNSTRYKLTMPG